MHLLRLTRPARTAIPPAFSRPCYPLTSPPAQTIARVYLFTPSAFAFDGITSIPFAVIDYNFLGVRTPLPSASALAALRPACHHAESVVQTILLLWIASDLPGPASAGKPLPLCPGQLNRIA